MRYLATAFDYDGTLASGGVVSARVIDTLEKLAGSGRRLFMVTGRELDDLQRVFNRLDLFERVVAENGGLLYRPATKEAIPLCDPPPPEFVTNLRKRGVDPISAGRVIVATWHPNEDVVLDTIRSMGLELHVVFNKGAVMVLPSGVNKASGLAVALSEVGLSAHNVLGMGDAENDHAFLSACEAFVAVANAVPALKDHADWVTEETNGEGVRQCAEALMKDGLHRIDPIRHHVLLGQGRGKTDVTISPYGENILLAGPSGSGKTSIVNGWLERVSTAGYQFCVVDPEGDYEEFGNAVSLGKPDRAPTVDEILGLLESPSDNAIVNLIGVRLDDRPAFLEALLPRLFEMRARTGRPHWIVIDEAHHLLPAARAPRGVSLPESPANLFFVTIHPDLLREDVVASLTAAIATEEGTLEAIAEAAGHRLEEVEKLGEGDALLWRPGAERPLAYHVEPAKEDHRRHARKYAEGDLEERAFFFRGPEGKLHLRAQNLAIFMQMADGVDDETWMFHLKRGDIKRWFKDAIKDDGLAQEAERAMREKSPEASRAAIRAAIEGRYTAPASVTKAAGGKDVA